MALRIALFGQAPIALGCLDALRQRGHEIAGVFAPPAAGRPDPLAARAMELGVPLFQRRYFQLKNGAAIPKAVEEYRSIRADLNVLASLTETFDQRIEGKAQTLRRAVPARGADASPQHQGGAVV